MRMDRTRFEHLLAAYGADFRRWPADERAAAEAFLAQYGESVAAALEEARALDVALDGAKLAPAESGGLAARILAAAPRTRSHHVDRRALWALAACAVFGVLLGYGGGRLAVPTASGEDYFAMAFESPFSAPGDDG